MIQNTTILWKNGTRLRCVQEFHATKDDELSLEVNDVIEVDHDMNEQSSFRVHGSICSWNDRNGMKGYFPANCMVEDKIEEVQEEPILSEIGGNPKMSSQTSSYELIAGIGAIYEAKFRFEPSKIDELSLKLGDRVVILESPKGGWWRGEKGDQAGWFPATLVERVNEPSAHHVWPNGVPCGLPEDFDDYHLEKSDTINDSISDVSFSSNINSRENSTSKKGTTWFNKLIRKNSNSSKSSSSNNDKRSRSISSPIFNSEGSNLSGLRKLRRASEATGSGIIQCSKDKPTFGSNATISVIPKSNVNNNHASMMTTSAKSLPYPEQTYHASDYDEDEENSTDMMRDVEDSAVLASFACSKTHNQSIASIRTNITIKTNAEPQNNQDSTNNYNNNMNAGGGSNGGILEDTESPTTAVEKSPIIPTVDNMKKVVSNIANTPAITLSLSTPTETWIDYVDTSKLSLLPLKEKQRQTAIWELISTERDYVRDLRIMIQIFKNPLIEKKILSSKQSERIFHNIDNLLNINKDFLDLLEIKLKTQGIIDTVGEVLVKTAEKFLAYTLYCSNHNSSIQKLQSMIKTTKDLRAFLDEINKYTESTNLDYLQLNDAYEKIQATITIVNQSAKMNDTARGILQIQNNFTEKLNFVTPNRYLVREDDLFMVIGTSRKQRKVFLFNDLLIIARKDWRDRYHLIEKATLRDCRVCDVQIESSPNSNVQAWFFEIEIGQTEGSRDLLNTESKYMFLCSAYDVKKVWLDSYKVLTQLKVRNKHLASLETVSMGNIDLSDDDDDDSSKTSLSSTKKKNQQQKEEFIMMANRIKELEEMQQTLENEKKYLIEKTQELEELVNDKQIYGEKLSHEKDQLFTELMKLNESLVSANKAKMTLQNNLDEKDIYIREKELKHKREVDGLKAQIVQLETDMSNTIKEKESRIIQLESTNISQLETLKSIHQEKDELQVQLDQVKVQHDHQVSLSQKTKTKLDMAVKSEAGWKEIIQNLNKEKDTLSTEIMKLKDEMAYKVRQIEADTNSVGVKQQQTINRLEAALETKVTELQIKTKESSLKSESIKEKDQLLQTSQLKIQCFLNEIAQSEKRHLSDLQEKQHLINVKVMEIEEMNAKLTSKDNQIKALNENVEEALKQNVRTKSLLLQIEALRDQLEMEHKNTVRTITSQIEDYKDALKSKEEIIRGLNLRITSLQKEKEVLKEIESHHVQDKENLANDIALLDNQFTEQRLLLERAAFEYKECLGSIEKLENLVAEKEEKIETLQERLEKEMEHPQLNQLIQVMQNQIEELKLERQDLVNKLLDKEKQAQDKALEVYNQTEENGNTHLESSVTLTLVPHMIDSFQSEAISKLDSLQQQLEQVQSQFESKPVEQMQSMYEHLKKLAHDYHEYMSKALEKNSKKNTQLLIEKERELMSMATQHKEVVLSLNTQIQDLHRKFVLTCDQYEKDSQIAQKEMKVLKDKLASKRDSAQRFKRLYIQNKNELNEILTTKEEYEIELKNWSEEKTKMTEETERISEEKKKLVSVVQSLIEKHQETHSVIASKDTNKSALFQRLSDIMGIYIDSYKGLEEEIIRLLDERRNLKQLAETNRLKIKELELLCRTNLEHTKVSSDIIKDVQDFSKTQINKLKDEYEVKVNVLISEKKKLEKTLEGTVRSLQAEIDMLQAERHALSQKTIFEFDAVNQSNLRAVSQLQEEIQDKDKRLIQLSTEMTQLREFIRNLNFEKEGELHKKENAISAMKYLSRETEKYKKRCSGLLKVIRGYQVDLEKMGIYIAEERKMASSVE